MHPRPRARRLALLQVLTLLLLIVMPSAPVSAAGTISLTSVTAMSPSRAAADRERLWADGCMGYESTTVPRRCYYGNLTGTKTIALVGDSHAAHLFPAVEKVAKAQGWRLAVFVKVSCPFIDMKVTNLYLGRVYWECATWNANVIKKIAALRPAMTLVAMSRFAIHPASSLNNTLSRKGLAIGREIAKLAGRVTMIVDSPDGGRDVPSCLAAHRYDIRACAISKTNALSGSLGTIERVAVTATGDKLINLTSAICSTWPCPVVRNKAIIFRDGRHLTATFSRTLAPALAAKLVPLVP